ncbi:hypothetical protein N0V83_002928 [Neocucurbitaria cava]|uniref:Uncharacterized protein n=1 Tax=Neocucurbitaria cava TaxID=798079 RepID=A0A9W8YFW0_9PLEO|nr:hypothetical protein N0V83_002928 [Neocucurbitaria cava]
MFLKCLKRKVGATENMEPRPHKCAKSTHNGSPWPTHIYMTCRRITPTSQGGDGTLHIDTRKCLVWFEYWFGTEGQPAFERKQIDLYDSSSKHLPKQDTVKHDWPILTWLTRTCTVRVGYYHNSNRPSIAETRGYFKGTRCLILSRLGIKGNFLRHFQADCSARGWKMWGTQEYTLDHQEDPKYGGITEISDITIILDAIVHCIDRQSGRPPVHDPNALFRLRQKIIKYGKLNATRKLSEEQSLKMQALIKEMKTKEENKKRDRVIELETLGNGK